jgi:hypothetical protein
MNENKLPESYMGFSTRELLVIMDKILRGLREPLDVPSEMIIAVRILAAEYKLTPEAQVAEILRNS